MRHLLTLFDLSPDEIQQIFALANELKMALERGERQPYLAGRVMGLLFEKPSLRTRVSFETAMAHLGGSSQFLGQDVGWGQRESVEDFARVLSQYVDIIVCRTRDHQRVEQLARHSSCSVINGLTSVSHPCQALADLFTLREVHGCLSNKTLAFIGDGNNVARSLAVACGKLGVHFVIASPPAYHIDKPFVDRLNDEFPKLELRTTDDPVCAVRDAVGVYTDVWASMGQEKEQETRKRDFRDYQVDGQLMAKAPSDAVFLHCLPAHRGEEVTDEVIDGPQSIVVQQAANRMHVQKGILAWLLGAKV